MEDFSTLPSTVQCSAVVLSIARYRCAVLMLLDLGQREHMYIESGSAEIGSEGRGYSF